MSVTISSQEAPGAILELRDPGPGDLSMKRCLRQELWLCERQTTQNGTESETASSEKGHLLWTFGAAWGLSWRTWSPQSFSAMAV